MWSCDCTVGTAARQAGGEAWNLGQNVAFGPGQSKATRGLHRVSLNNEKCKYVTNMHRKKTYFLTAERRLAEWFTKGRARGTQLYYKRVSRGFSISGTF
jgi:hypothetical protein